MKEKCITQFLAFLTAALTCTSVCTFIPTGNPNLTVPGTGEPEIVQDLEKTEDGEEEPGIFPQSDKNDNDDNKVKPNNAS